MNVLLIQNCSTEGFGHYETTLKRIASKVQVVHQYRGDPFPNVRGVDAVIVGGTGEVKKPEKQMAVLAERMILNFISCNQLDSI